MKVDGDGGAARWEKGRHRSSRGVIGEADDDAPVEEAAELKQVISTLECELDSSGLCCSHASADSAGVTGTLSEGPHEFVTGHRHSGLLFRTEGRSREYISDQCFGTLL